MNYNNANHINFTISGGAYYLNPSYFRIKLPIEAAKNRFCEWMEISEMKNIVETDCVKAIELSCNENGTWRGQAVFFYQNDDWTVFEDLSGGLSTIPAESWLVLAHKDPFTFAGYNDAIPYGELIVIENGEILREFLDIPGDPEANINKGKLSIEEEQPIESWLEVASFVDEDELAFSETGWLWVNENTL